MIFAMRLSAAIGCGLMAGLFFAFSIAVMRGFERLPAAVGYQARWTAWNHVRTVASVAAAVALTRGLVRA